MAIFHERNVGNSNKDAVFLRTREVTLPALHPISLPNRVVQLVELRAMLDVSYLPTALHNHT
jgi:ABC-type sugar transport system permease subunit